MRFCNICGSILSKTTQNSGTIIFICRCLQTIPSVEDDTLMAEEYMDSAKLELKHQAFIDNSPYDPAAQIVLKDCPNCPMDFMTLIVPSANQMSMFTCSCGIKITNEEYNKVATK